MVTSLKRIIYLLIFFAAVLSANAQNNWSVKKTLQWKEGVYVLRVSERKQIKSFYFEQCSFSHLHGMLPISISRVKIMTQGKLEVHLKEARYEEVKESEVLEGNKYITAQVQISVDLSIDRHQAYAVVTVFPFRRDHTGRYERLTYYEVSVRAYPGRSAAQKVSILSNRYGNAALSSGDWYKMSVTENGIYKLNYSTLQSMGLEMDEVIPSNIRIYGNGGGMLPEANADFRQPHLMQNYIQVVDQDNNGKFDKDDFVLFYGQGPDQWYYDTANSLFKHKVHLYSSKTYYFLTADVGEGFRILDQSSTTIPANMTVNSFDDHQFHEVDIINHIQSGRRWYGEDFDAITSRDFSFSFPNLLTSSSISLSSNLASRSTTGSASFVVLAGGKTFEYSIPGVGVDYTDPYYHEQANQELIFSSVDDLTVKVSYNKKGSSIGWLDYLALNARRRLIMTGDQMEFRDITSSKSGDIATFQLSGATSDIIIWDVTDPVKVKNQKYTLNGSVASFRLQTDSLRQFIAFNGRSFLTPQPEGAVKNQGLRILAWRDMLIITSADLRSEVERLASYHRTSNGLRVEVVDIEHIYNEFSSGAQDITAIRDFVKMFYDRFKADPSKLPKYLLLFGDGSYDYKNITGADASTIPVYESVNSNNPILSYTTDDYYGFLDYNEGGSVTAGNPALDIAIGRIPAKSAAEAKIVVDKILHYVSTASFGSWRNSLCFIADDEDNNTHINASDRITEYIETNYPVYNIDKIYLDAYKQEATPGGSRYPDVKEAINARIRAGTFLMNYTGHGGGSGWAHERILEINDILSWENLDKLPLIVTATCSFAAYDDHARVSPGEHMILSPKGGAIALLSTVRLVFSNANEALNTKLIEHLFKPVNGKIPPIGEIVRNTKNDQTDPLNNRKFAYLGDPALTLAYPRYNVITTKINETLVSQGVDTLKALAKVTISGEMRDESGNRMPNFNGIVYPVIYDKVRGITTLKNDPGSNIRTFNLQKNALFKGKASVKNGSFSFTFVVPKDISYKFGNGKISYYASNSTDDANGYFTGFMVGGAADSFAVDNTGPEINLFLNDEKFVFGGITDENPTLILKLFDENGINTVGNGIGHDLTAVMDEDTKSTMVLNDFYEGNLDDYQRGEVRYPLNDLENGQHSLTVKAWDVYNNSNDAYTEFLVVDAADFTLSHVLNYPNPFTTSTEFMFEHNRPGDVLDIKLQVYTVTGKVVKRIYRQVFSTGYRVDNIYWDGLDDYGDKIGRGVYIYKLSVRASDGSYVDQFEKLFILR